MEVFYMATTNLNIRTDKAIKDQAEEIFKTWLRQGVSLNLGMYYWLKTEQQQAVWE